MARIHLLEKQVAELIAAGEVVERPASIVKELLENAVDAGATAVTVEIQGGGVRYIRVTDNGAGIVREDVPHAFLRHATSKVRQEEDLYSISTMGFRGEALASIAAMCRVELLTRTADETAGTHYEIAGGEPLVCEDAGCPVGTTILVRDVFYNTPARMKFLKRDTSEGNSVAAAVEKLALGNPGVGFKFIRDGVLKMQTPGDGNLISAIRCIFGKSFSDHAITVDYEVGGLRVRGCICKPQAARGSRAMQNFFINTRFIRSKTCMAALEQAYKNALMVGKFPYCVLDVSIPPQTVDVNVHPAKTEVRFADEQKIFELIYYGCKTALGASSLQPELELHTPAQPVFNPFAAQTEKNPPRQQMSVQDYRAMMAAQLPAQKPQAAPPRSLERMGSVSPVQRVPSATPSWKLDVQTPSEPLMVQSDGLAERLFGRSVSNVTAPLAQSAPEPLIPPEPSVPEPPAPEAAKQNPYEGARLVGELFGTYLLLEHGDELLMIDKHAAHERLLFNRLVREGVGEERQLLLSPVPVQLSQEEAAVVLEHRALLEQTGLTVEDFGGNDLVIREVAPILAQADLPAILAECAQKLLHCSTRLLPRELEDFYHIVACRAAIKARDNTPAPTLAELIRLLAQDGDAAHCPHGRPVAVRIRRQEIEKRFGRLG